MKKLFYEHLDITFGIIIVLGVAALSLSVYSVVKKWTDRPKTEQVRVPNVDDFTYVDRRFILF